MGDKRRPKRPSGGSIEDGLAVFRDRIFTGENMLVDGCHFHDCEFVGCKLSYAGGAPFFVTSSAGGRFSGDVEFIGAADNVLHCLRAMHVFGMADFVERVIARMRNAEDGTVQ